MNIDYEAIEDALFDAVKASTQYLDANIIFDSQDGISPAPTPYATIRIGDLIDIGQDASSWDFDRARPAGEEIVRTVSGMRYLMVTFAFFSPDTDADPTGRVARSAASKMQVDLGLESIRSALNQAGLGVLDKGNPQWVPKLNNTDFEGRAMVEVRFAVAQGAQDKTGYIDTVNAVPIIDGVTLPTVSFTNRPASVAIVSTPTLGQGFLPFYYGPETLGVGQTRQLRAIAIYPDGSSLDITDEPDIWDLADTAGPVDPYASVVNGLVTGIAASAGFGGPVFVRCKAINGIPSVAFNIV